jgi:hypothetical protein
MTMSKFFWIPPACSKLAGTSFAGMMPLTGSFPRRQKACFFEDFLDHSTNMKSPPRPCRFTGVRLRKKLEVPELFLDDSLACAYTAFRSWHGVFPIKAFARISSRCRDHSFQNHRVLLSSLNTTGLVDRTGQYACLGIRPSLETLVWKSGHG